MENRATLARGIAIVMSGVALVFLAQNEAVAANHLVSKGLEALGFALAGYGPLELIIHGARRLGERKIRKSVDEIYRSSVSVTMVKQNLPVFVVTDIEGCITPPYRTAVDLRKLQVLRSYCQFVKATRQYPQIVVFTGRSQGYVEFLAQTLNVFDSPLHLPFVIENGAALYHVDSKRTEPLVNDDQRNLIRETRSLLERAFQQNEFEPKAYMITINPREGTETVDELREKITLLLKEKGGLIERLTITSTASAVDITAKGISKLSGLERVLDYYLKDADRSGFDSIVALGDSPSDLDVLKKAGSAYCPAENVHPEVRKYVEARFGVAHVISLAHIDFVIRAIEMECGLRLL